jgi:hypothetical protein
VTSRLVVLVLSLLIPALLVSAMLLLRAYREERHSAELQLQIGRAHV